MTWTDEHSLTHRVAQGEDGGVITRREFSASSKRKFRAVMFCGQLGLVREIRKHGAVDCMTCLVKEAL